MLPKISILISIHNGSETLDRCFQNIKDQTFQDFRIICIDDYSTDNSYALERKWQQLFGEERFTLIKNEKNIGLTKSLNKGLNLINTPYTARIDADDWWQKEKLEKQIIFMENNPSYGIVGCNYINLNKGKENRIVQKENDQEIKNTLMRKNPFAHSCVIFKTELIKNMDGYDESVKYGQDYELWLRILPETRFYNIQEFLCWRSLDNGISIKRQREQMLQCVKTQLKYIKKYDLPIFNYIYIIKPLLVALTPSFIRNFKRKIG